MLDVGQAITGSQVQMMVNTPLSRKSRHDEAAIRREARTAGIPCLTRLSGTQAAVDGTLMFRQP